MTLIVIVRNPACKRFSILTFAPTFTPQFATFFFRFAFCGKFYQYNDIFIFHYIPQAVLKATLLLFFSYCFMF